MLSTPSEEGLIRSDQTRMPNQNYGFSIDGGLRSESHSPIWNLTPDSRRRFINSPPPHVLGVNTPPLNASLSRSKRNVIAVSTTMRAVSWYPSPPTKLHFWLLPLTDSA